jgi:peptidyl-prolyl cis-trans isomerase A (cyclophilin A)
MARPRPFLALALAASVAPLALVACSKIAEPDHKAATPAAVGSAGAPSGAPSAAEAIKPVDGPIALAEATEGLAGQGALYADLETDKGKISCKLFDDKAPKAVANFVGLARGKQPFRDPVTGKWTKRAAYDGTTFHRIMKGFMIQGGDPTGTGTGGPGYEFADELWQGARHDRAGQLSMANTGPNHNGMQWFITDDAAPHLDGDPELAKPPSYTIFGECSPLDVVHAIAGVPVKGERPLEKPRLTKVTIRRG